MQTTRSGNAIAPTFSGVWLVQPEREAEVEEEEGAEEEEEAAEGAKEEESRAVLNMSLADWLLLIPDYDGCPSRLESFAAATRYVASQLGPNWQRVFLLALSPKLRGTARIAFGHRIHRYESLEQLLTGLRNHFAGRGRETELLDELGSARQYSDESIWEFAARVERLVSQLCCIYEKKPDRDFVRELGLTSFRRGLRSPELETRLGACEASSLEDAIALAIAIDNEIKFRDKQIRRMCLVDQSHDPPVKKRRYR